jgi:hypothetical protein
MSQLIKQLKSEAWSKAYELAPGEGVENYRANLAQDTLIKLVANACISQIVKVSDRHTDNYVDAALKDAAYEIEVAFGME